MNDSIANSTRGPIERKFRAAVGFLILVLLYPLVAIWDMAAIFSHELWWSGLRHAFLSIGDYLHTNHQDWKQGIAEAVALWRLK